MDDYDYAAYKYNDEDDADIVRAVFLSDPRGKVKGKQYHYRVPGAKVGDIITGPGATGPAEVVGIGRKNWKGPVKTGSFWSSVTPTPQFIIPPSLKIEGSKLATFSGVLKDVYSKESMHEALYGAQAFIPIHAKDKTMAYDPNFSSLTPDEQAAKLDQEAKRIRKAEKKRKRIEREDKRREKRREDAMVALHSIVNDERMLSGVRVDAAKALLNLM